jgi:UDP-N-acetyl-D-mannosaminuronate dehydrogenase
VLGGGIRGGVFEAKFMLAFSEEAASTTYPGTNRDVIKPILEQIKLKCGKDFFIAYSPEREDPGNSDYSTAAIPKVVGAESSYFTHADQRENRQT